MVDILDEALEDIRRERAHRLFFKYANAFVSAVTLFLIISVAYYAWNKFATNKIYAAGSEYTVGRLKLQSENYVQGMEMMEKLAAGNTTYSALAGINYASSLSAKRDFGKAATIYSMIESNKEFDQVFRDFAALMAISSRLNSGELSASTGVESLNAYIAKDTIFSASANELLASLYIALGEKQKAQDTLDKIVISTRSPATVKAAAQELMLLVSSKAQ